MSFQVIIKFKPVMSLINESVEHNKRKIEINLGDGIPFPHFTSKMTKNRWEKLLEDKDERKKFVDAFCNKRGLEILFEPSLKLIEDERIQRLVGLEKERNLQLINNEKELGELKKELTDTRNSLNQEYQSKLKLVDVLLNDLIEKGEQND